jgi:predicted dehydrogenase/threonine dehydrogenase-like Zn-dependent dehydrogenase
VRQVVLREGRASLLDVPIPSVPAGGVLVRTAFSVISAGTERANLQSTGESVLEKARRKPELVTQVLQSIEKDGLGVTLDRVRNRLQEPVPTGYACSGIVEAVGNRVKDLSIGQWVACGGARHANHAQFVAVPRNLCCPVPDGVSPQDAASATLGAIALQGVRQAHVELGHLVAVVGLGLVGLLEVQLARAAGARVIAVDVVPARRELALRLGAAFACAPDDLESLAREASGGLGLDACLIAAATKSDEPLRAAMRVTRKRGVVVIVGDVGLALDRSPFYEKEIELRIACSMGPGRYDSAYEEAGVDYPAAYVRWTENRNMQAYLELLREARVQWAPLVSHTLPLDQAEQAFALLESEAGALAISLSYDSVPLLSAERTSAPRPAKTVARSGTIRLGVIGAGSFARAVHFPTLRRMADRFSISAVATRSGLSAATAAREAGAAVSTADYRELLTRDDVDAVLIATRHDQHARLAMEALAAGKAVFLEKPLAIEPGELAAVLAAVEASGLPFMVGFNRRFSAGAALLRERLAAHAAPAVVEYRVNASRGGSGDWSRTEEGGGRAVGEACHMLDFLHAVLDQPLDQLQAMPRPGADADANFSVQLRFRDGSLAHLLYTTLGHAALPKERIEAFLGDEVVLIDDFRTADVLKSGLRTRRREKIDKGYRDEWAAFHRACTAGPPFPIPLEQLRSVAEASFRIRDACQG